MANLKNITDLPVAESAEGLNLIVNDNGSAKQIAASAVGAQADWAVTDEGSPAFIKNKPVEDLAITVTMGGDNPVVVINSGSFDTVKAKMLTDTAPIIRIKIISALAVLFKEFGMTNSIFYMPENHMGDGSPEMIGFTYLSSADNSLFMFALNSDNTIEINIQG